eukprot:6173210-Pleurochrysis_carterae.AAC.1
MMGYDMTRCEMRKMLVKFRQDCTSCILLLASKAILRLVKACRLQLNKEQLEQNCQTCAER